MQSKYCLTSVTLPDSVTILDNLVEEINNIIQNKQESDYGIRYTIYLLCM